MLEPYTDVVLEYLRRKCPLALILENLSRDFSLRVRYVFVRRAAQANRCSQRTLERFLLRFDHDRHLVNTPTVQQSQPPVTPRTRRRAEIRHANNVLTELPHRRRRRPIGPVEPPPPPPFPPVQITRRLAAQQLPAEQVPAGRHLLARQPLEPPPPPPFLPVRITRRLAAEQVPTQQLTAQQVHARQVPARLLPARRHLLARQPLDPLMNVAHSLGFMHIAFISPVCNF